MKKILISLLLAVTIVSLTGCGKKNETKGNDTTNKNETINNVVTTKNITLEDEDFGITTFTFDGNKDYEIREEYAGKYVDVTISSKNDNFKLQLYHFLTNDISYENNKESRKESSNYKEYKWNNFDGYTYNGSKNSIDFNIFLKNNNGEVKALFGSMEYKDDETANIPEFFESDTFQKFINTITFSE